MIASFVGGPFDGQSEVTLVRPVQRRAMTERGRTDPSLEVSTWLPPSGWGEYVYPGPGVTLTTYRKVYEGTLPGGELVVVYVAQPE